MLFKWGKIFGRAAIVVEEVRSVFFAIQFSGIHMGTFLNE